MKYPPEYEVKMQNGLRSSFYTLYCVIAGVGCLAIGIFGTIDALVQQNWRELLLLPLGAAGFYFFFWLGGLAQKWGMRNLEEAEAIRNEVYKTHWENNC